MSTLMETKMETLNRINLTTTMSRYGNTIWEYYIYCRNEKIKPEEFFKDSHEFLIKMIDRYNFRWRGFRYRSLYRELHGEYYIPDEMLGIIKTSINGIIKPSIDGILKNATYKDLDEAFFVIKKVLFAEEKVLIRSVDLIASGEEFAKM